MERYHVPFHVYEREWTMAQFLWLLRGIRRNEAARAERMEAMREGRDGIEERELNADERSALSAYLPASMVDEAVMQG